jgi:serralysin
MPESDSFNTSADHDWFAVSLTAGHDYSFWAVGSFVNVVSALRDSSRTILDSQGVVDGAFAYTAISSGTEYLDISASVNNLGGQTGNYQISTIDLGADTALDTTSTKATLMMEGLPNLGRIKGVPESGSLDTSPDHDWWAVSLVAGHHYTFTAWIVAAVSDTLSEVAIDLRDSSGTILNSQGVVDAGPVFQTRFTYTATSSGTEYLDISAGGSSPAGLTGNYQVFVTDDGGPDTVLDTASTSASLGFGGNANRGALDGVPESAVSILRLTTIGLQSV